MQTPLNYKTVLLIDDDQDEHLLVEEALLSKEEKRLSFNFYFSARSALEHLEAGLIKPDLIVVDINMPIMTGIEFLEELKKKTRFKHIPVIVHSTAGDSKTQKHCESLGASAFLQKALNYNLLLDTINVILGTPR